jgi:hypothetical protein
MIFKREQLLSLKTLSFLCSQSDHIMASAPTLIVIKAIGNNEEQKENHSTETQDFNVENPLQQRVIKTTGAS